MQLAAPGARPGAFEVRLRTATASVAFSLALPDGRAWRGDGPREVVQEGVPRALALQRSLRNRSARLGAHVDPRHRPQPGRSTRAAAQHGSTNRRRGERRGPRGALRRPASRTGRRGRPPRRGAPRLRNRAGGPSPPDPDGGSSSSAYFGGFHAQARSRPMIDEAARYRGKAAMRLGSGQDARPAGLAWRWRHERSRRAARRPPEPGCWGALSGGRRPTASPRHLGGCAAFVPRRGSAALQVPPPDAGFPALRPPPSSPPPELKVAADGPSSRPRPRPEPADRAPRPRSASRLAEVRRLAGGLNGRRARPVFAVPGGLAGACCRSVWRVGGGFGRARRRRGRSGAGDSR